jgi:hypothetical protein
LLRLATHVMLPFMENVTPIALGARSQSSGPTPPQVVFDRKELMAILNVYGRMVSAGHWRDYALSMDRTQASFACFERTAERPDVTIVKCPDLARKQGAYALIGRAGAVLKRGHDLRSVLAVLERKLMKLVDI